MKKWNLKRGILATAATALTLLSVVSDAQAGLTITPTLVVIQGRERFADLSLINSENVASSYNVSWVFNEMQEGTGFYKTVTKSVTDFDLTQNIMFSPKRVALPASGVQKIRLSLRLKGEPPAPGDYRAHLLLQGKSDDPAPPPVTSKSDPVAPAKSSIGIGINVGFSIPVVYRVGESTDKIEFGPMKTQLNPESKSIEVVVPITKTKSTFGALGNLLVYYNDELVGQVKNANIFPEITQRTFNVSLKSTQLVGGSLHVVYKDVASKKDAILAEKDIPIGK